MSQAGDRELEDEARALLRPHREPPAAPAEVKARALRRLALALPIVGPGGGGGPPDAPPASPGGAGPAASGLGRALAARVPAWSLLASFLAGGALVAVATRPAPVSHREAAVEAPVAMTAAAPAAPSVSVTPPLALPVPVASAAPPVPVVRLAASSPSAASGRAGSDGALEAERALLDVARTALGRGDGANALRATEEHGRRFPRGILAEEREAMSIQALRLLHRDDDAQARLERFRGRFPTSLIRPALEADGGAP